MRRPPESHGRGSRTRTPVLNVGLEDLLLRIEGVHEGMVLVRVEARLPGVFGEQ